MLSISKFATVILAVMLGLQHLTLAQLSNVTTPSLNLTAITASNGSSIFECWQIASFAASAQAGTSGALNLFLSDAANISYTIIPARFDGGLHRAPAAQYVMTFGFTLHISLNHVISNSYPPLYDAQSCGNTDKLRHRFVYFTSGLAHVTLPNTTESPNTSVWVQGGKYGLIIAADTANVSRYGHITTYPSDADTVAVQIPFADGAAPGHIALHDGPCVWEDLIGL